jgi:NADPH2:quinone reductase
MRAIRCHDTSGPAGLRWEELPEPPVGKGQVRIDVHACGVNFPDLLISRGLYQFKPTAPFSPGSELAGVIGAVGEGVTRWRAGDRVAAFVPWGAFTEQIVLGEENVARLADGVGFDHGASLLTTYGTCLHALEDRARLRKGENVLVLGAAGGVGTAAIEIAKAFGARVIAAASSPEKLEVCKALGADAVIDYEREDLKARAKALGGADVVVDPVGGKYFEDALRSTNWEGRYLVIGFAGGEIPRIPMNLPLLKGCSIVGVFWGAWLAREPGRAAAQLERLGAWILDGTLKPHIQMTMPLADAAKALELIDARKAVGKIVLRAR